MSSLQQNRSAIAEPLSADVELALIHIPARVRESFRTLFAIDAALADVVARSTDPMLSRIKLAWWREQLEALDDTAPPPEPRLRAVAEQLIPLGIRGAEIAELEVGWTTLLDDPMDPALVAARGSLLFGVGARLLGSNADLSDAGALYALASVARRGVPQLLDRAREYLERVRGQRMERRVRPLTMLARAAARDLRLDEPEGSRGRAAAMLAHRWSGRIG